MVSGLHSPSFSIMEEEEGFSKEKLLRYSTQHVPIDSISPYNHNVYGVFGYPPKNRHVGKKYQAEIPPMMSLSNYSKVHKIPPQAIPITLGHEMHENSEKGHYFVPGLFSKTWDKKQRDIFGLGLYIYGKDFERVKNFMGKNKTMGEILSFYYEKFCKSLLYMTWKGWQKPEKKAEKLESEKRVFGVNIFQQPNRAELMSRIKRIIPKEFYIDVAETFWLYQETMVESFEKCLLRLMDYIELSILVEAIGIGKGSEEDLTVIKTSGKKPNNVEKVANDEQQECLSNLTHRDIVNILSNLSLNKPRPMKLFWEAIWPRLEGRGWHYEKQGGSNDNEKIMFFVPGVKHFSEKLEKGKHYFDSIDDMVDIVTLNPEIMMMPIVEVPRNHIGLQQPIILDQGTEASTEEQGDNYALFKAEAQNPPIKKRKGKNKKN